jgi:hypothetical protein
MVRTVGIAVFSLAVTRRFDVSISVMTPIGYKF